MADELSPEAVGLLRNLTATPSLTPSNQEAANELVASGLAEWVHDQGGVRITDAGSRAVDRLRREDDE